jgi:signal peptidase I
MTAANATTSRPRRPLLAVFAGLLLPGLGHVYCGQAARGASWLLSVAIVVPVSAWLALHGPAVLLSAIVVLGGAVALALYVASVKSSYRLARSAEAGAPGPWNRGHVYFACFALGHLLVLSPLTAFTKDHLIEAFKVPSASMVPAILPGDRFFADKRVGHRGGPPVHRGDVAVFVYPNDRTTMYVKRVVGLPGDRIQIDGMQVLVNGQTIVSDEVHDLGSAELNRTLADHRAFRETVDGRSYTVLWRKDGAHDAVTTIVPNGQVFVLGDNRDSSRDSRQFGTLPLADVSGVARQVWFSAGSDSGLRFRRTGKVINGS